MAVRSKTLAHFATTPVQAGWWTVYTCPAGRTAIAKEWQVLNRSGGARTITFAVRRAGADVRVQAPGLLPHLSAITGVARYLVLQPADQLMVFVGGEVVSDLVEVYVHGVELDGVAP